MIESRRDARLRHFHVILALLSALGLIWAVAKWRGWIGGEPLFQPLRSVILGTYLMLMAASWVALRRSSRLASVFLTLAVVAFVLLVANMMAA